MRYPSMRRFVLHRHIDETGISGTGEVAEGIAFWNGLTVVCWKTSVSSLGIYQSIAACETIHGHGGKTEVVWVDPDPTQTA